MKPWLPILGIFVLAACVGPASPGAAPTSRASATPLSAASPTVPPKWTATFAATSTAAPTRTAVVPPAQTPTAKPAVRVTAFAPPAGPVSTSGLLSVSAPLSLNILPVISSDNAARVELLAHRSTGEIRDMVWCPDGKTLAVVSAGGTYLYDANTLELQRWIGANSIAFACGPDGRAWAWVGADRVQLWDAATGQVTKERDAYARHAAFSPDGQVVAIVEDVYPSTTDRDTYVTLWDVASGHLLRTIDYLDLAVDHVAFSPDGQVLATSAARYDNHEVELWDLTSGQLLREFITDASLVTFSPDGSTIVTSRPPSPVDIKVRLWDVATGQPLREIDAVANQAVFSPDGQMLAFAEYAPPDYDLTDTFLSFREEGKQVSVWDVASGRLVRRFDATARFVAFSPDGTTLAAGGSGDSITFWGVASGQLLRQLKIASSSEIFLSDDAALFASVDYYADRVTLWDIVSGQVVSQVNPPLMRWLIESEIHIPSAAFSPDLHVLAAFDDRGMTLWDMPGSRLLSRSGSGYPFGVVISPDKLTMVFRQRVGTGAENSAWDTILWSIAGGQPLRHLGELSPGVPNVLAFSPDGRMLALQDLGGERLLLLDAATGQPVTEIDIALDQFYSENIAWSPDGRRVAAIEEETGVSLWDTASGQLLYKVEFDGVSLTLPVAFSPDGRKLVVPGRAVALDKYVVMLIDVASGKTLHALDSQLDLSYFIFPAGVAFSPDSRIVALFHGGVELWDVASGKQLMALATGRSGSYLGGPDIAFSADGRYFVTDNGSHVLQLWGVPEQ